MSKSNAETIDNAPFRLGIVLNQMIRAQEIDLNTKTAVTRLILRACDQRVMKLSHGRFDEDYLVAESTLRQLSAELNLLANEHPPVAKLQEGFDRFTALILQSLESPTLRGAR